MTYFENAEDEAARKRIIRDYVPPMQLPPMRPAPTVSLEHAERMAAEAERDRYRAALERIAASDTACWSTDEDRDPTCCHVAVDALNGGDDE